MIAFSWQTHPFKGNKSLDEERNAATHAKIKTWQKGYERTLTIEGRSVAIDDCQSPP